MKSTCSSAVSASLRRPFRALLALSVLLTLAEAAVAADPEQVAVPNSQVAPALEIASAEPTAPEAVAADAAWFGSGDSLDVRARSLERRALELGSGDVEHAARALISSAAPGRPMRNARLATRLAPHLPIVHAHEARVLWDEGHRAQAAEAALRAIRSIPQHLEASLWLFASLLAVFAAVALIGSLTFVASVAATFFRHAAHDLGDLVSAQMPSFARAALLASVLLIPILLGEGLLGFALVLFGLGFLYGTAAHRLSLALAAVLILLSLYPLSRFVGTTLAALTADPVANASYAVVHGLETPTDIDVLQRAPSEDALAEQALAVLARREGRLDEARERYQALLASRPLDPVVSTNLANLLFRTGRSEEAIELYERVATQMESATALFNLSQAYAVAFRMEDFETSLGLAQALAPETTAALSRTGDPSFVADLPLPVSELRRRMLTGANGDEFQHVLVGMLAPGLFGNVWWLMAGGFFVSALLGLAFSPRYEHSSCCSRCGRRICIRCDAAFWNSEVCDPCHHLYHRPETTDPALRTARLAVLRKREARLDKLALAASITLPGAAGLLARRPDHAYVGTLFFVLAAALLLWRNGAVPDPLAIGVLGPVVFTLTACLALLGHLALAVWGMMIRRSA